MQLLKRKLSGRHYPLGSLPMPERKGSVIGIVGLSGDVDFPLRPHFSGNVKHARIGNDQSIARLRLHVPQLTEIFRRPLQIAVVGKDIGSHIHLHPMGMGKGNSLFHFFQR